MGIPLPKGDIQTLVFSLQDGPIPLLHVSQSRVQKGAITKNVYVHKVLDSCQTPSMWPEYIAFFKTTLYSNYSHTSIGLWLNAGKKSKLFCLSATARIQRGREERKEQIMMGDELVRKDFTEVTTLELRLARWIDILLEFWKNSLRKDAEQRNSQDKRLTSPTLCSCSGMSSWLGMAASQPALFKWFSCAVHSGLGARPILYSCLLLPKCI